MMSHCCCCLVSDEDGEADVKDDGHDLRRDEADLEGWRGAVQVRDSCRRLLRSGEGDQTQARPCRQPREGIRSGTRTHQ